MNRSMESFDPRWLASLGALAPPADVERRVARLLVRAGAPAPRAAVRSADSVLESGSETARAAAARWAVAALLLVAVAIGGLGSRPTGIEAQATLAYEQALQAGLACGLTEPNGGRLAPLDGDLGPLAPGVRACTEVPDDLRELLAARGAVGPLELTSRPESEVFVLRWNDADVVVIPSAAAGSGSTATPEPEPRTPSTVRVRAGGEAGLWLNTYRWGEQVVQEISPFAEPVCTQLSADTQQTGPARSPAPEWTRPD